MGNLTTCAAPQQPGASSSHSVRDARPQVLTVLSYPQLRGMCARLARTHALTPQTRRMQTCTSTSSQRRMLTGRLHDGHVWMNVYVHSHTVSINVHVCMVRVEGNVGCSLASCLHNRRACAAMGAG